jgi:hypothetical protein
MEVITFNEHRFQDIPEQDNPAFDTHRCFMICKTPDGLRYSVLYIDPTNTDDTVCRIAEFFDFNNALIWTDRYLRCN